MLSVLIPVYNTDVRQLAAELSREGRALGVAFEIRIYDDASNAHCQALNASLDQLPGVVYRVLPQNIGRSKIRNLLAHDALYAYLLFLDADAAIPQPGFLRRYLTYLDPERVIYGGRCYAKIPPSNPDYFLHWRVGRKKEEVEPALRQKKPYLSFMSNNFVVHRDVFARTGFDEQITSYGHEDTVFGVQLHKLGIPLLHLDNPLEHTGLEPAGVFLDKSRTAALNLWVLHYRYPSLHTPLLQSFRSVRSLPGARYLLSLLERPLHHLLRRWRNCPLWLFDVYKLSCLCNGATYLDSSR